MLYCVASGELVAAELLTPTPFEVMGVFSCRFQEVKMWGSNRPNHVPARLARKVHARDGHECQIHGLGCTVESQEVDHIIPLSQGGSDDLDNLRAVCRSCHKRKTRVEAIQARRAQVALARFPGERHPGRVLPL